MKEFPDYYARCFSELLKVEKSVVIQEFIIGNEYGLDVFNDLEGRNLATVVKRKLAMRSGETDVAEVVDDSGLACLGRRLSNLLRHRGNLDIDVMLGSDLIPKVLEVNARFGGEYPFTHLAGANYVKALVDIVSGKVPNMSPANAGIISLKSIVPVRLNNENNF
jgi:carbamoyl-phosphate synthase large subunit